MSKAALLLALVVGAGFAAPAPGAYAADWADEFDGSAGALPDATKWNVETGSHGFGGGELQAYTNRSANLKLDGQGNLVITALRENYSGMQYTSARINTEGKFEKRTGTFEWRAKLSRMAMGLGPAIWTVGGYGSAWPLCCELDVLELFLDPVRLTNTVICADLNNSSVPVGGSSNWPISDMEAWHTYRVDKTLDRMIFYVDGVQARNIGKDTFGQWKFDLYDHFIVMNLAVGGNRPWGPPDASTPFPATLTVDYVRWWAAVQSAPTGTTPPTPPSTPVTGEQSGSLSLKVDTNGRTAVAGTPASSGVLFPMGHVLTTDHLRLRNAQGSEIPANYKSLATWPDGSVKSALVSFTPAPQNGAYPDVSLQYGPSVTHAAAGAVQVTQDTQNLTITSDVLRLQISKQRFTALEQVWTDLNSDGSFDNAEKWLTTAADLIIVDDKSRNTFRTSLWTAADGYAPQVIESGPNKVTVLLEGRLKGVNGAVTADGDPTLAQAKIWLSVTAGSSLVHVQTTFIDTKSRPTETFTSHVMRLSSVALELPLTLTGTSYAVGGDNNAVHQGSNSGGAFVMQDAVATFNGQFSYNFVYSGAGSGSKAAGWMDVSDSQRGLAFGVKHFWQNYPKKLAVSANNIVRMELLPAGGSEMFWTVYPGVGKTHEGFLDFHAGGFNTAVRQRAELMLFAPPVLLASPSWYVGTNAFGPLSVPSNLSSHWENYMNLQYNCTVLRTGCSILPQPFGQRNFGDFQQSIGTDSAGNLFPEFGDNHYEDPHGALLQFARTGERRWFDFAVGGARHHYDLDVMHTQNARYPGFPAGMIHWHGTAEHEGASIELGHVVPGGLDEYYLLTGDPRALEVIREQGNWVDYWARTGGGRVAPETAGEAPGLTEYERPTAWTLHTVMKSYEATGDPKYLESASILVKNTIDWWKWPQDHIVFDPNKPIDLNQTPQSQALFYQRSDWTQGTGYPLPTLRVDNCSATSAPLNNYAYQTHAPIAWMSGLLQSALIRYYNTLEKIGGRYTATVSYRGAQTPLDIDTATMREMLIQMVNMLANFTYGGAPEYPSQYPWEAAVSHKAFIYTVCPERDPSVANGGQYLAYTFMFVSGFDASQVSSRWQGNWTNLVRKWRDMAYSQYNIIVMQRNYADTSYNGAGDMWALPNALALLEKYGVLTVTGTVPPPPTGGGGTTTPPPAANSAPAYQALVNDGNPFITDPVINVKLTVPSAATEVNVSTTGLGQGAWTAVQPELHGIALPAGAGAKTLYLQFRDGSGTVLAALTKSLVLLQAGFSGDVALTLNDADDTFAFSGAADTNYGGRSMVHFGKYDNGYDYYGLLRFAIPAMPAGVQATVTGASLSVFLKENERNSQQTITPYEAAAAWNEDAVKWSNVPALSASAIGTGLLFTNSGEVNRWKTFTLNAAAVQNWVNDPSQAKGIVLKGVGTPGMTVLKAVSSEAFTAAEDQRPKLVLQLRLAMTDATGPVISNAQAVGVTPTSATIQWATNEEADGAVVYGVTTAYGQAGPTQATFTTAHALALGGLSRNTTYHVKVTSRDRSGNAASSADFTFTTPAVLVGDTNGDGILNVGDLPGLISQVLGISAPAFDTSDINEDGKVSVADLQLLVNLL